MGRCKDCGNWCGDEKSDAAECASEKFVYSVDARTPIDGLGYSDSEGWSAGFDTGPEFGCIHFKERRDGPV